jgi:hypothetical protein
MADSLGGLTDAERLALVRVAEVMRKTPKVKRARKAKYTVKQRLYQGEGEFPGVDIDAVHRNWKRRPLDSAQTIDR